MMNPISTAGGSAARRDRAAVVAGPMVGRVDNEGGRHAACNCMKPGADFNSKGLVNRTGNYERHAAEDRNGDKRAGGHVPNFHPCVLVHPGLSRWPPAS
jgi:hypothetical protein